MRHVEDISTLKKGDHILMYGFYGQGGGMIGFGQVHSPYKMSLYYFYGYDNASTDPDKVFEYQVTHERGARIIFPLDCVYVLDKEETIKHILMETI